MSELGLVGTHHTASGTHQSLIEQVFIWSDKKKQQPLWPLCAAPERLVQSEDKNGALILRITN